MAVVTGRTMTHSPSEAYELAVLAFNRRSYKLAYAFAEVLCRWLLTAENVRYFPRTRTMQTLTIRDEAARQLGLTPEPFHFTD